MVFAKLTGKIEKDRGDEIVAWLSKIAPDKRAVLQNAYILGSSEEFVGKLWLG